MESLYKMLLLSILVDCANSELRPGIKAQFDDPEYVELVEWWCMKANISFTRFLNVLSIRLRYD